MNTTEEVATKLVDYCRKGEWMKAVDDLYAKEIVSVEAHAMENMPAEMRGIDQVRGKTEWWEKNMEVQSGTLTLTKRGYRLIASPRQTRYARAHVRKGEIKSPSKEHSVFRG